MPTVNDFFCGAGGISIGFQNAGFDVVWACDFDKHCVETYKANVGQHVIKADIKLLNADDIPNADVWAFGFPCQDSSIAGKRKGFVLKCQNCNKEWNVSAENKDVFCPECGGKTIKAVTRSAMFFEIMRLLDEKDKTNDIIPKFLFIENVKGLKSNLPLIEGELRKRGYTVHTRLYNSKYWDVAQNRERYFIIGVRSDDGHFSMPIEQHNYIPPLSNFLEKKVSEKYYVKDSVAEIVLKQAAERLIRLGKVHAALTPARPQKRQNGPRAKPEETEMFTLTAQDIHGVIIDDTYGYEKQPRLYLNEAPTLRSGRHGVKVIDANDKKKHYVRKLTPFEYGKLQAFPMERWVQVVSDNQAYKQFGNAVTVTVVTAVAKAIKMNLK